MSDKNNKHTKQVKTVVIAFRLTQPEAQDLDRAFKAIKPVGVRSKSAFARKLAIDWSLKKLTYKNKQDRDFTADVMQA